MPWFAAPQAEAGGKHAAQPATKREARSQTVHPRLRRPTCPVAEWQKQQETARFPARREVGIRMTLLATERRIWHCGAHTAKLTIGGWSPILPDSLLPFISVARTSRGRVRRVPRKRSRFWQEAKGNRRHDADSGLVCSPQCHKKPLSAGKGHVARLLDDGSRSYAIIFVAAMQADRARILSARSGR